MALLRGPVCFIFMNHQFITGSHAGCVTCPQGTLACAWEWLIIW